MGSGPAEWIERFGIEPGNVGSVNAMPAGGNLMSRTMRNQMAGTAADEDTTPVAGGTVGQFSFPQAMSPVILDNATGADCHIVLNNSSGAPTATAKEITVVDGEKIDLSFGERLSIRFVSVFVTAGTVGGLDITGWDMSG